jgi:hypothetical protein
METNWEKTGIEHTNEKRIATRENVTVSREIGYIGFAAKDAIAAELIINTQNSKRIQHTNRKRSNVMSRTTSSGK